MSEGESGVVGVDLEGDYLNMKMGGGEMGENMKKGDGEEQIGVLEESEWMKGWDGGGEVGGGMELGKYMS